MQNQDANRAENRRGFRMDITDPKPVAAVSGVWRTASQAATVGIFVIALDCGALSGAPAFVAVGVRLRGDDDARADFSTRRALQDSIITDRHRSVAAGDRRVLRRHRAAVGSGSRLDRQGARYRPHHSGKAASARPPIGGATGNAQRAVAVGRRQKKRDRLRYCQHRGARGDCRDAGHRADVHLFRRAVLHADGRTRLRRVLVAFFDDREARLRTLKIMNDIEHNLTGYLSMVAVINFAVGLSAGIIAWLVGMPDPVAWAVLGFILNFIPYIGALIMEAALFFVGLVTFATLPEALVAPLCFLAFATLEGHFITPALVGRRLTLNPLTVFLSLVFWTWLWGPVGAFLAVPLLIMGLVAVDHLFPDEEPALPE